MFGFRRRQPRGSAAQPDAAEWYAQSLQRLDPAEALVQTTQQLRFAIARAERSPRPLFLRALGRDLETELLDLSARMAFGVGESASELSERRERLSEFVSYYCDAAMPWTEATRPVELSDCAREAVAGLSSDMVLRLRVEGEPAVVASRGRLISSCELTIQAAITEPDSEVEVVLPPCCPDHAEVHVQWTEAALSPAESRDKARFLALALAYAIKLGGTLRRAPRGSEGLVLRIPSRAQTEDDVSGLPGLDSDVAARAAAFCE